ncbi:putative lethal (2) giant larvae [Operophtera brumata]|uniref:Putative lethal (2) giant larvae n=1 Tax=Operophtera brumata TaxID=104452 RepID=A0A0L7L056_OPEBR|nr:putative lethal (2) giant larvae [Operophtera brumata]
MGPPPQAGGSGHGDGRAQGVRSARGGVIRTAQQPRDHRTGRLISLCDDNSLHLWEINEKSLVEIKSLTFEGKNKKVSAVCVESSGNHLLLGTEGGNLYSLELSTFTVTEDLPRRLQSEPRRSGSCLRTPQGPEPAAHRIQPRTGGLVGPGNCRAHSHLRLQPAARELVAGAASDRPLKEPVTPYGPYPCKAITKILNRTSQGERHVAFELTSRVIDLFTATRAPPDGAPLHEDRPETPAQLQLHTVNQVAASLYTVTVRQGERHVAFELTSRVIDPVHGDARAARRRAAARVPPRDAGAAATAHEEELVVIDLCDPKWRPLRLPYLVSIHAPWPISGGIVETPDTPDRQLLLTGHEDGSVRFWDVSGVAMTPLYKYTTAQLFRRVGTFDPYSDDPRLAVKRVILCPLSGMLTIGGAAGHIVIASLKTTPNTAEVKWEWGVVCAGTAHGLALLDAVRAAPLTHKCTLNPHDNAGAGDTPISRRKSFKKSLRESFRRLRKGRSQRRQTTTASPTSPVQVTCQLAKEIQLKHRAPVIGITILDGASVPLPDPLEVFTLPSLKPHNKYKLTAHEGARVARGVSPLPEPGTHRVVITSEEQFKVFTLPSLKPHNKYKLTAHEGARRGEALYLHSSSELQRISLAANKTGTVTVPAGTDPKLILEMFDRQRAPLSVPVPPAAAATETN